jgi:hypothetical protein
VAILGDEKSGKTHFWCTFPKPIVCLYTDPNTQTADGFIEEGQDNDITLVKLPSTQGKNPMADWQYFADRFVPAVKNRQFDAKTIVIDSYSFLAKALVTSKSGLDGKVSIPEWGQILMNHGDRLRSIISSTQPMEGKPSYHVVVTSHLVDVTDDKQALIKTRPAIQGAFKDEFGKCFGTVLIAKAKAEMEIKEGKLTPGHATHYCYTVPPNQYLACGDGVGGKAGRKELPPIVENTYQALCAAWGIEED